MSEKKVYAVSSGDYSDYGIHAVFSTRELAEQYIAEKARTTDAYPDHAEDEEGDITFHFGYGDDYGIEEWALDEEVESPEGCYVAEINRGYANHSRVTFEEGGDPRRLPSYEVTRHNRYVPPGYEYTETWTGYGETREHALRSARELMRAVRAGTVVVERPPGAT